MQNPFLSNRKSFITYSGIWVLVMGFHVFLLILSERVTIGFALADGIISNVLFAAIGLGLWFPIFFSRSEKEKILSSFINHIFACVITIGIWITLSYFLLYSLFGSQTADIAFLRSSLPWRASIGILYYGVIILVYFLMIFYRTHRENLVKESQLMTLVKESELSSLKSQINPHFLFNSLNSISSLTMIQPEKAQEMIIKLSDFLRYSLSNKDEKLTALREEINNINRYLDIEKIRFGKRLVVVMKANEACYDLKLPGLILQPLVENAIKFGVYESTEESVIEITSNCNPDALSITIRNAFDPEFPYKKGEGIGLKNIRSRLGILYNRDDLLTIRKGPDQYEVNIMFP